MPFQFSIRYPVRVIRYLRFRFGRWEVVRMHYRGLPSR